ncbi:putative gamma-glutamylcyclotransferase CG2811 isoform X1 [Dermacentor silvarum]|uniref:putative gamma-glutamylcyclotransferase CG2811 isoform X1 n=1 Tax=Dermacentor silvarum TaxID=543639 RepID=UPI002100B90E|nr:putative gamma-glutamylcyclotransferase CG2811 isoform X1 [Dermacentor silvarum]XP_049521798.1 putative gamma-glutamylcyclotransferase CG2811 isoform X1 [Dermacentor silvarum]
MEAAGAGAETHYVFVYGTLKMGETNHKVLTNPDNGRSTLVGQARTLKKWPLVLVSSYEIPCLLPCEGVGHEICGEVYQVDDRMLNVLDCLESHPHFYVRSQEDVMLLPPPKSTGASIEETTPPSENSSLTEAGDRRKAWIYFVRKFELELLSLPKVVRYTLKPGIEWPELICDKEQSQRFLDGAFQHFGASDSCSSG